MKIGIVGTRGIPANYGGFETFAEKISPLLVEKGFDVTVYCDKNKNAPEVYKGVKLKYQKTTKSEHSLLFYLEGIFLGLKNNDVIILAGTAGSFFYFLNFFFRKKIITNTDGVESRRAKWSKFKRLIIKISETLSVKYSQHLIADSKGIKDYLLKSYPNLNITKIDVIEYGAIINQRRNFALLDKHSITHKNYYLVVSRLEPENNVKMIVEGYQKSNTSKPLIIIGNLLENDYVQNLLHYRSEKIKFIGGVYDQKDLMALRTSAFAYIHGHSVGGTNPSLLEALGSGNISICHDNIFNREVTNNNQLYFSNPDELKEELMKLENLPPLDRDILENKAEERIAHYYTWENMANKYFKLLNQL